jgi:hypothetical protein
MNPIGKTHASASATMRRAASGWKIGRLVGGEKIHATPFRVDTRKIWKNVLRAGKQCCQVRLHFSREHCIQVPEGALLSAAMRFRDAVWLSDGHAVYAAGGCLFRDFT